MDGQAVAKEMNVQAVLTGRVTQRGDRLSINVELIKAQDKSQIWGQQYNRNLTDVFAVQEEIAKEISEKLRLKLSGTERQQLAKRPTENLKAFQYYMQGRAYAHRRTREDLLEAIHYCEKAIEEDRNYALAYAGLADAYTNLGSRSYVAPLEGRRKAEEAVQKALALDENLAEAHATLGQAYTLFTPSNFSPGDRELRRAIELSPSLAVAHHFLGVSLVRPLLIVLLFTLTSRYFRVRQMSIEGLARLTCHDGSSFAVAAIAMLSGVSFFTCLSTCRTHPTQAFTIVSTLK